MLTKQKVSIKEGDLRVKNQVIIEHDVEVEDINFIPD